MPLFIFIFTLYLIDVFRSHLSVVQAHSAARVTVDDRVLGVLGSEREKDDKKQAISDAHDMIWPQYKHKM